MFSLLHGFWQMLFAKPNIHVLIIGLDHAGKTTILEKIKEIYTNKQVIPPEKIPPTVGMNLAKITYNGSKVIFWDLGGQMKMRSMWEKYYEEANCVIFVIDAADVGRLDEAKFAYDATCEHDYLSRIPIFTFANKQDKDQALSPSDLSINFYPVQDSASRKRIFSISALTGEGIEDAMSSVVNEALAHAKSRGRN